MPVIAVDDPDDPRIAVYRNVRDRDLAGRGDGFIAEGEVVIRHLLDAADFEARSLLVAAHRLETRHALLAAVPEAVPVYAAPQAVMDGIVGFPIHRGLLAFGRRRRDHAATDLLARRPALVLGLVGIANHDNIGGLFRNAAAFGAGAVLIDGTCCDPLYRKALRVSVGGVLTVPFARTVDAAAMVEALLAAGYTPVGLSPAGEAQIGAVAEITRPALLLGAEGPGLPRDLLARIRSLRIDMAPGFDSLNVATAGAIALHELRRALRP